MTEEEREFRASVKGSLKAIAQELRRIRRLAAIRVRHEVAMKVGPSCMREINEIMED